MLAFFQRFHNFTPHWWQLYYICNKIHLAKTTMKIYFTRYFIGWLQQGYHTRQKTRTINHGQSYTSLPKMSERDYKLLFLIEKLRQTRAFVEANRTYVYLNKHSEIHSKNKIFNECVRCCARWSGRRRWLGPRGTRGSARRSNAPEAPCCGTTCCTGTRPAGSWACRTGTSRTPRPLE